MTLDLNKIDTKIEQEPLFENKINYYMEIILKKISTRHINE